MVISAARRPIRLLLIAAASALAGLTISSV
jgi:hypothetical protein